MAETRIKISKRTLKKCVDKNGDLVIDLDLDSRELEDFPQGNEVFLRSCKDDLPENYNSELCLAGNQLLVYVHDEPFRVSRAVMRALTVLYKSIGHEIDYSEFAKAYSENTNLNYKECNEVCNSAVRFVNKKLSDKHIPITLTRSDSLVHLEVKE